MDFSAGRASSASVGSPQLTPGSEFLISKESKSLFYALWDKQMWL